MKALITATLAAALLAVGCGTTVSADTLAETPAAISAAEEAGARELPEAELHLKYAEEQYVQAKALVEEGEEEAAERMLDRAREDARLALEMARLHKTREAARVAERKVEDLRQQAIRK